MPAKNEMITQEEATRQVLSIVNRMALLHYSFAKMLVKELGEKKGKDLTRKAIDFYGKQVGEQVKEKTLAKGLQNFRENYQEDLPMLGWNIEGVVVDGEPRARIHACNLAKVWNELGDPALGRLYCYMDQAKYAAYNPELECVHVKNTLDGDPYCELAIRTKKLGGSRKKG
jgi:hypothetical protein